MSDNLKHSCEENNKKYVKISHRLLFYRILHGFCDTLLRVIVLISILLAGFAIGRLLLK